MRERELKLPCSHAGILVRYVFRTFCALTTQGRRSALLTVLFSSALVVARLSDPVRWKSSAPRSTMPRSTVPRISKTVYLCGYDLSVFVRTIFPEYATARFNSTSKPNRRDILAIGMHLPCAGAETFPGTVFYLNGEAYTSDMVPGAFYLGPVDSPLPRHMQFYYASLASLLLGTPRNFHKDYTHFQDRFLLYVQSKCHPHREDAFRRFADIGEVWAGGKCHGNISQYKQVHRSGDWTTEVEVYSRFKFGLVMENTRLPGYVTEKILAAFVGGTVPIYYGTEEIFELFNAEAFIFYNESDPQSTMTQVKALMDNETAYAYMLSQPAVSSTQYETHFSLTDDGNLVRQIQAFLESKDDG